MERDESEAQDPKVTDTSGTIADILTVLSDVARGNYSVRLETDLPDTHPLGALRAGINEMIASLAAEQQQGEAYRRELEEKLSMIERQRAAIRELSTPIIEVWEGILCLPIVGIMDSARSADMTDALLRAVVQARARCAIIDVTGLGMMDTRTADHFIRMANAVGLLGSECVLTGINPQIAQIVVRMGFDMRQVKTYRSLRDALRDLIRDRRPGAKR